MQSFHPCHISSTDIILTFAYGNAPYTMQYCLSSTLPQQSFSRHEKTPIILEYTPDNFKSVLSCQLVSCQSVLFQIACPFSPAIAFSFLCFLCLTAIHFFTLFFVLVFCVQLGKYKISPICHRRLATGFPC